MDTPTLVHVHLLVPGIQAYVLIDCMYCVSGCVHVNTSPWFVPVLFCMVGASS